MGSGALERRSRGEAFVVLESRNEVSKLFNVSLGGTEWYYYPWPVELTIHWHHVKRWGHSHELIATRVEKGPIYIKLVVPSIQLLSALTQVTEQRRNLATTGVWGHVDN